MRSVMNSAEMIVLVFLISTARSSWGQLCNVQRKVSLLILSPQSFFGSTTVFPGSKGCEITQLVDDPNAVLCNNESVLFDGNYGPETFDLDEQRTLNRFVGWSSESYMMFDMGALTTITAIDISVVNVPSRSLGLPNIQIYSPETVALIDVRPTDSRVTVILYDYLQNEHLSSSDRTVRDIILRPRREVSTRYLLLRWTFTDLAIENFALSEIRFCGDNQPRNIPQPIRFQTPIDETTNVLPSARDFQKSKPLVLTCTVANSGSFTWQWTRNDQPLTSQTNIEILIADGTRTTTLTIFNPSSRNGNVAFSCQVSDLLSNLGAARHYITLPLILINSGYVEDMPRIITCEAYGYIEDINSEITWAFDGNALSSKFRVRVTSGSNQLVSFDGRSRNSIISILEIPYLMTEYQGLYECSFASYSKLRPVILKTTSGLLSTVTLTTVMTTMITTVVHKKTSSFKSTITPAPSTSEQTILITVLLSIASSSVLLIVVAVVLFYAKRHHNPLFKDFSLVKSYSNTASCRSVMTSDASTTTKSIASKSIASKSRTSKSISTISGVRSVTSDASTTTKSIASKSIASKSRTSKSISTISGVSGNDSETS